MNWLDSKYSLLLSNKLERFRKIGEKFNFRCPVCGDSKTSESKSRGWIYSNNNKTRFGCFNCGASMSFQHFIKYLDTNLYSEYLREKLLNSDKPESHIFADKMKKPDFVKKTGLFKIKKISSLEIDHPAKLYIEKRKIPTCFHHSLFYAPKFKTWVNDVYPGKFRDSSKDEPRLIIPFLSTNKEMFGFQGRSFRKDDPLKYITIMLEDKPKIYGLDRINMFDTIFMFEGPIDSMFIHNSLASAGGKIDVQIESIGLKRDQVVIVYDNEPRSIHTINKMYSSIDSGLRVCIWPENIHHKDINDMILHGMTSFQIENIIKEHSYSGSIAKLKLLEWRRC